jgi:hypothetical protein
MKKIWLVSLIAALAVLFNSVPVFGAPPDSNPGKGPLDRIIFVHYPSPNAVKPGTGQSSTGVFSPDYKYSGIRWPAGSMPVSYYVNTSGSGTSSNTAVSAVCASLSTWDNASSGITFYYNGTTVSIAGVSDSTNVISWADITKSYPGAIAVTFIWYYRWSKTIYEVDTVMNSGPGFAWSYTEPQISDASPYADPENSGDAGSYDIRNIMTHEAGHWLMLGDLYNSKDSFLTMYGYGSTGEIKKDTLGRGDIMGITKAYGP